MRELISIIMPLYNCVDYISEAIESVLFQTYGNWELIVVDDASRDGSLETVESYQDSRIKVIKHDKNRGAAAARNTAIQNARGRYIAFFDSDDVWLNDKLEKQSRFMEDNDISMCFTAYETIEADGEHRNFVSVPKMLNYKGFLKNTVTCSHTIMFDTDKVNKEWLVAPHYDNFDFPEDMAVWLQVLKHGITAYGLNSVLAKNRKRPKSRSAFKLSAIQRTWNQYRRIENLNVAYSSYCLFWQLLHAIKKRL